MREHAKLGETEPIKSEGHRKGEEATAALLDVLADSNLSGQQALAEFHRAPAATRTAFWTEVRKRTEAAHVESRKEEAEAAELGFTLADFRACIVVTDQAGIVRRGQRRIWGKRWRHRAYRDRLVEERGRRVDDSFPSEKARLESIEAVDYVFRLAGVEANRSGYLHCPLPGHDERTPSFSCKENRWRCYGCGERGSIYELAGILWDLPRSGRDFRSIHDRLMEVFP